MSPKDYSRGHSDAMNRVKNKDLHSIQHESEEYKHGHQQGLTQAHNLNIPGARRLSRGLFAAKEHEMPYWKKD